MSLLLLTLGHNSSAILVEGNEILIGYENERLTGVKSDSSFPVEAIMEISKWYPIEEVTDIFISHWFTNPDKPLEDQGKWYNEIFMKKVFPKAKIHTLSKEFSHHDAHANSARVFAGADMPFDTHTVVADGFGSYGEVLSIYGYNGELIFRSFGFGRSIGLLYQYATSYLDMKENQDEYKLLGYEGHIEEVFGGTHLIDEILDMAHIVTDDMYTDIMSGSISSAFDPMISIDALVATKKKIRDTLGILGMRIHLGPHTMSGMTTRVAVSFFVQTVVQNVMLKIFDNFKIRNANLVGGVFLNVKLNNEIAKHVSGLTCVMPLSGDQGAAIGLCASYTALKWPGHLYWGHRSLIDIPKMDDLLVSLDPHQVVSLLNNGSIVNLVRGSMEFGARALGHTSTLALPSKGNVEYINNLNSRSTIMPMAPIVSEKFADEIFMGQHRIVKSLEYMSCARDCEHNLPEEMHGVTHNVPLSSTRTCRPQIVSRRDDPYLSDVLNTFGVLINTSFNEHGKPIVFKENDIMRCHSYQKGNDVDNRVVTVVMGASHE